MTTLIAWMSWWQERAIRDLEAIVRSVAIGNPSAALRFGQALTQKARAVGAFPDAGRVVPEIGKPDIREVLHGAYRIVYGIRLSHSAA